MSADGGALAAHFRRGRRVRRGVGGGPASPRNEASQHDGPALRTGRSESTRPAHRSRELRLPHLTDGQALDLTGPRLPGDRLTDLEADQRGTDGCQHRDLALRDISVFRVDERHPLYPAA